MTASISPLPPAASSCVPFALSREGDRKGVLLVIGGCPDSRPLGLVEIKLLFEFPKPWAELHDTLLPRPAQTLLPGSFCKGLCSCSRWLRAQLPRDQTVLSGTYPPRPQAEMLTWVGGRLLSQSGKKSPCLCFT